MFDLSAVQDPGVLGRQPRGAAGLGRPRRPAVHAHHLAAGHLAAAARLQLRVAPRCGPAIYMLPLTAGFLLAGPVSGALSDRFGARWFATGGLLLTAVSFIGLFLHARSTSRTGCSPPAHRPQRHRLGAVLLAEHDRDHEQRAGEPARHRLRHARHVLQLGDVAVDRHLLHADDHRAGRTLPSTLFGGLTGQGVQPRGRQPGGRPAAGVQPVRGVPRVQPDPAAARPVGCAAAGAARSSRPR